MTNFAPIPKPRKNTTTNTPIPKPRKSIIKKNEKKQKSKVSLSNDVKHMGLNQLFKTPKSEKHEYSYRNDLKFMFAENINKYQKKNFRDVENEIRELLSKNIVVKFIGTIFENDKTLFRNYEVVFNTVNMLDGYITNMSEKYDLDSWKFSGDMIMSDREKFNIVKKSKKGRGINSYFVINEYMGENCYIPTQDECFIKSYIKMLNLENRKPSLVLEEEFSEFLFSFQSKNRKGIMTNAKISKFNTKFNETVQYFTDGKDNHLNPRNLNSNHEWCIFLYFQDKNKTDREDEDCFKTGHYCLIRKSNKRDGIQEIKNNFKTEWKSINQKVNETAPHYTSFNDNSKDEDTYIWDLETYPCFDSNDERINSPYACACINLKKFNHIIDEKIDSEKDLPDEELASLRRSVNVFVGNDCINQMMEFLGKLNKKKIILIAHNSSGFDAYFVIRNKEMILQDPPIKTSRGILTSSLKNPFTAETTSNKWR
jgi:hypothetical protein